MELSENALAVLKARYLLKDKSGAITETPEEMFQRDHGVNHAGEGAVGSPAGQESQTVERSARAARTRSSRPLW